MDLEHIVKLTTGLADPRNRDVDGKVGQEMLPDPSPAPTAIIAGIDDEAWLLEIEAIAAA